MVTVGVIALTVMKRYPVRIQSKVFCVSSFPQICLPTTKTALNSDGLRVSCCNAEPFYDTIHHKRYYNISLFSKGHSTLDSQCALLASHGTAKKVVMAKGKSNRVFFFARLFFCLCAATSFAEYVKRNKLLLLLFPH